MVIPLRSVSADSLTILAVATEWDSKHGGLSTFNRELCTALAQCEGVNVLCAVPALEDSEVERARKVGVRLVAPVPVAGVTEEQALAGPLAGVDKPVHAVIGQGRISGPAALAQVKDHFPEAAYLHFLHMDPRAIEWQKDHEGRDPAAIASQRVDLELELGRQARLIFAVGPELRARYSIYFHPDQRQVLEFLPGLTSTTYRAEPPLDPSCLVFARAEDAKLKGLHIAAKAMAELSKFPRHDRTRLTILGAKPGTGESLRSDLLATSGGSLSLHVANYTSDRAKVVRELRSTALVLMPSIEEGFGLTGLEAISEGIPVLLSAASGLAQALQKHVPTHAAHHIFKVPPEPEPQDIENIAERMRELLDDRSLAFDRVAVLRDAMKETFCWDRSAQELIAQLRCAMSTPEVPGPTSSSPRPSLAERLSESLTQASLGLRGWKQTLARTGEWLERPEQARLLEHCREAALPGKPLVVLGGPGSGKSALLARLVGELQDNGIAVLAIKADFMPTTVASPIELERWLGLPTPVPQALSAVAALQRTVLVIDQLDALADLVDLKSERLNLLLALVAEVAARGQVPIVLSCRTFELEHDARLRSLECERLSLEPLALEEIQRVVAQHAPETTLTVRLSELLRQPHTLNLFLSLAPERRAGTAVESHQSLVRARWEQLVAAPGAEAVAQQVAELMSQREELWLSMDLPESRGLRQAVNTLLTSGLLVQQIVRGIEHVAFAHQTLFEFGRARAFLDNATLPQFVRARQQGLFVRPILWATLPYLRAADLGRYLQQLHELWSDGTLRSHVQALLVEFLGQLPDPVDAEIALFTERLNQPRWQKVALGVLAGQKRWFEILAGSCLPGVMAGANAEYAIGVLLAATEFAPEQVAELMERVWWPRPEQRPWIERVLTYAKGWSTALVAQVRRLVEGGAEAVDLLIDRALEKAPKVAVELIEIELDRKLQLLPRQPEEEWRSQVIELVEDHDPRWNYILRRVADHDPQQFAHRLFPWFARAIQESGKVEDLSYGIDGEIFPVILREAVSELTARDSAYLATIVGQWEASPSHAIHRILVTAMQAALPSSAQLALQYLLRSPPLLGGVGSRDGVLQLDHAQCSRQLIEALAPHLAPAECERLEQHILASDVYQADAPSPEWRRRLHQRNREHRFRLLSALGKGRVTPATRKLMEEEARTFGELTVAAPWDGKMRHIGSPMSAEQMLAASDAEILGLFQGLPDTTEGHHPHRFLEGGSEQASREFANAVQRAPERFAALLPTFQPDITENPVCHALEPLASHLPLERIEALILQLVSVGFSSLEFRSAAASACRKALQGKGPEVRLSADLLVTLEGWLGQVPEDAITRKGEAEAEELDAASVRSLLFPHGGWFGLPRGTWPILDALTFAYLREEPPQVDAWMEVLERHLERADAPEVWRAMAGNLQHVLRAEPQRAERFFSNLFAEYPSVLQTSSGLQLIGRAMQYLPLATVQRWMEELRAGSWVRRDQAFGELLALLVTRHDATPWAREMVERSIATWQAAPGSEDRLILGLTIGVAELWDEPARRERASELLLRLVPHASGAIAKAAMAVFSSTAPLLWDEATRQLLRALAEAPTVLASAWLRQLVNQLDQHLPADAALIADVAISLVIELAKTGRRTYHEVGDALSRIALSLHRQPTPLRERGLELFERLLALEVDAAQSTLRSLDRVERTGK